MCEFNSAFGVWKYDISCGVQSLKIWIREKFWSIWEAFSFEKLFLSESASDLFSKMSFRGLGLSGRFLPARMALIESCLMTGQAPWIIFYTRSRSWCFLRLTSRLWDIARLKTILKIIMFLAQKAHSSTQLWISVRLALDITLAEQFIFKDMNCFFTVEIWGSKAEMQKFIVVTII